MERLQKVLARYGVTSRRKAEDLILAGVVCVNGKQVNTLGTKVDADADQITVGGKLLNKTAPKLFLFNKPRGIISTLGDPRNRPSLADYVKLLPLRVFPLGRLDADVSGLILFSNDGDFAHSLLHPSFGHERTYLALVATQPTARQCQQLCQGVHLKDGIGKALSAQVIQNSAQAKRLFAAKLTQGYTLELVVAEGRKHFVKRLIAEVGLELIALSRTAFGKYRLGRLKPGEFKEVDIID